MTRRTRPAVLWSLAAVLALAGSTASSAAVTKVKPKKPTVHALVSPLTGTWSGQYSGAFSGNFTLTWKPTRLIVRGSASSGTIMSGTITLSSPKGTYNIKGRVSKGAISFGALDVGATYTGTVKGKSMSGKYSSPQGGGSWSAQKT